MSVRVRFAPSPTGMLHVGGARTALYDWLLARKLDGKFIVRIEDTDSKRFNAESVTNIYEGLEYLGMLPDEGPNGEELIALGVSTSDAAKWTRGGDYGPYTQSRRKELYQETASRLVREGKAYYVFSDDLEEAMPDKKFKDISKEMRMSEWRDAHLSEVIKRLSNNDKYHIRLKLPRHGAIVCLDSIRGKVTFKCNKLTDPVILKTDGMATYHLANVVDDAAMEITHVLRGEEWLSSYPIHHFLYEALGYSPPVFMHLPVILNPVGSGKMSKRAIVLDNMTVPTFVSDYKKLGYVPEALINYMALLGWSSGNNRELFSIEELINEFDPYRIGRSGARWDIRKLQRMNQHYIKSMSPEKFARSYFIYVN